ncbi:MAG TPA: hypothetical protein VFP05_06695 [Thermomicrobiales bacterium]|nr:hypothetical protein [Thermomicrobiales bacterium]
MKRFVFAPLLALMLSVLALSVPVAAQDATPISPDPSLCTLTPPSYEEVAMYAASPAAEIASPAATPSVELPAGDPVDDATRDAVEQSMIVNVACLNTGNTLLTMAAYTDEALGRLIGGAGAVDQELYDSLATPKAIAEDERTVITEFQDMVLLPDGRVAVIIVGDNQADDSSGEGPTLFYLKEVDGHWYIDDYTNPDD